MIMSSMIRAYGRVLTIGSTQSGQGEKHEGRGVGGDTSATEGRSAQAVYHRPCSHRQEDSNDAFYGGTGRDTTIEAQRPRGTGYRCRPGFGSVLRPPG